MGLGGLVAIVGGLLFVVVVIARGARRQDEAGRLMIKTPAVALQWLFMRVEALFNRAFGDRLNPLYHLGAISFFLFWIVAASGLYLYAFFETGVAGAYALGRGADARPVVCRRHHAQRAPLCLRRAWC